MDGAKPGTTQWEQVLDEVFAALKPHPESWQAVVDVLRERRENRATDEQVWDVIFEALGPLGTETRRTLAEKLWILKHKAPWPQKGPS